MSVVSGRRSGDIGDLLYTVYFLLPFFLDCTFKIHHGGKIRPIRPFIVCPEHCEQIVVIPNFSRIQKAIQPFGILCFCSFF